MKVVANDCSKLGRRKVFTVGGIIQGPTISYPVLSPVSPPHYMVVAKQGGGSERNKGSYQSSVDSMDIMRACLPIPCLSIGVVGNTMILGVWNIPGSDAMKM